MRIEFFKFASGEVVDGDQLLVMNGSVYQASCDTYESQCAVIDFDDFIKARSDLDWRVVQ